MAFQVAVLVVAKLPFNDHESVCMPALGAAVSVEPAHKVPVMVGVAGSGGKFTPITVEKAEEQPLAATTTV